MLGHTAVLLIAALVVPQNPPRSPSVSDGGQLEPGEKERPRTFQHGRRAVHGTCLPAGTPVGAEQAPVPETDSGLETLSEQNV